MFITNNQAQSHLRWKENLVKYKKALKYYVLGCSEIVPKSAVFMDPLGIIVPVSISKKSLFGVIT